MYTKFTAANHDVEALIVEEDSTASTSSKSDKPENRPVIAAGEKARSKVVFYHQLCHALVDPTDPTLPTLPTDPSYPT